MAGPTVLEPASITYGPDGTPIYGFQSGVTAGVPLYIDPLIATGYTYEIGAGDPNFSGVIPPANLADTEFELWTFDGTQWVYSGPLTGGQLFDLLGLSPEGLPIFQIRGIDPGLGLDPNDPDAFVTGVTFVGDGQFTGTMTPLTQEQGGSAGAQAVRTTSVPEPGSLTLLALGLAGLGAWRVRPRAACQR